MKIWNVNIDFFFRAGIFEPRIYIWFPDLLNGAMANVYWFTIFLIVSSFLGSQGLKEGDGCL